MSAITRRFTAYVRKPIAGRAPGEQLKVGTAVEWEAKKITIELDVLPVGSWWSGVIKLEVSDRTAGAVPELLKRYDVVAAKRGPTADAKPKWIRVGGGQEFSDGTLTIDVETQPAGAWWDGKLHLFDQKPKKPRA